MKHVSNGYFIISLDFELHWGVFDKKSISEYKENLENVKLVIPRFNNVLNKNLSKVDFHNIFYFLMTLIN